MWFKNVKSILAGVRLAANKHVVVNAIANVKMNE
jgi:hypothetical protein